MKTIVVPTDFSKVSKNAIAYAVGLAEKLKAKITLIHAYHTFPIDIDPGLLLKEYKDKAELFKKVPDANLKAICDEINNTSSCKCTYVNYQGLAKDVIVEYAKESNPDLLVIGTEKLMPIERIVYGTITGKVIKEVECSVLVVPENVTYSDPKKIVFAIDYHDSDLEEIKFVEQIVKAIKSEVHIVHVISDDEDMEFEEVYFKQTKTEIKKTLSENNTLFKLIKGESISEELEKYINEKNIDILAVAKTKKSFLEDLFSEDITRKLFYNTKIPLLIFKAEDESEDFI